MKFSWAAFFLFIGLLSGSLNQLTEMSPDAWKPYIAILSGFVTLLGGLKAFYVNPDGTSARSPYQPIQKVDKRQQHIDFE